MNNIFNKLIICLYFVGSVAFMGVAAYFLTRPSLEIQWQEKAVFSAFFAGAILCMGFSCIFHTFYCHSEKVGKFFNKYVFKNLILDKIFRFLKHIESAS